VLILTLYSVSNPVLEYAKKPNTPLLSPILGNSTALAWQKFGTNRQYLSPGHASCALAGLRGSVIQRDRVSESWTRNPTVQQSSQGLQGGYKGESRIAWHRSNKLPRSKRIGARFRYKPKTHRLWTKKGRKKLVHITHKKPGKFRTHHIKEGEFRLDRARKRRAEIAKGKGKQYYQ